MGCAFEGFQVTRDDIVIKRDYAYTFYERLLEL